MFKERRKKLLDRIKEKHAVTNNGAVFLCAGFEHEEYRFRQESSFYYFTGINEPGAVLWLTFDGHATLFIPNHGTIRKRWVYSALDVTQKQAENSGVDVIAYLGDQAAGYQAHPFFSYDEYKELARALQNNVTKKESLFTLYPNSPHGYVEQRHMLERLYTFVPGLLNALIDISGEVAQLRRKKDMREVEYLFKAIEITAMAHDSAAQIIKPGNWEFQVQAALEYIFTESGARDAAFPSVVASGPNSVILHYENNARKMQAGDLVIVDIGARYQHYCADVTRTYPVSGKFTVRQREVYDVVLETHKYIAELAQPGYWLRNENQPDKSLHHLAQKFLQERGYEKYFPHSIGHFLGLDVHDVGDYAYPLEAYDVITIEPGVYIPEDNLGIRIEDNYLVGNGGLVHLSEDLPFDATHVEEMLR